MGIRKRAILDVDLPGRDEQLGAAVNKKPQKTRDLNEKSRDSRLGFLCLPDWLSFEPILKGSPIATLFVTILSALKIRKALLCKDLRSSRPVRCISLRRGTNSGLTPICEHDSLHAVLTQQHGPKSFVFPLLDTSPHDRRPFFRMLLPKRIGDRIIATTSHYHWIASARGYS